MGLFDNVSDQHVRAILEALCDDKTVYATATDMVDELKAVAEDAAADAMSDTENDLAICVQCKKAFSAKKSGKRDCIYHWGGLTPDYEADEWADNDEARYGDIDTDEHKRDFPDGFVWECCDEIGTSTGCTKGPHRTERSLDDDRDMRLSEPSDDSDESEESDEDDME